MTPSERLACRAYLVENISSVLREVNYHRTFDIEEDYPGIKLWQLDEDHGSCAIT